MRDLRKYFHMDLRDKMKTVADRNTSMNMNVQTLCISGYLLFTLRTFIERYLAKSDDEMMYECEYVIMNGNLSLFHLIISFIIQMKPCDSLERTVSDTTFVEEFK